MDIKEIWSAWRESVPPDRDMKRAFERACTPQVCHELLIEAVSAADKIAELEKSKSNTETKL
jgi:hypothetical protein